jgi:hypothetical protein
MRFVGPQMQGMISNSSYGDTMTTGHSPIYMTSHMSPGHGQGVNNQGQMAPSQQQQHHHPNSTPSPAQQHSMAQTQAGNPPQLIYQTAGMSKKSEILAFKSKRLHNLFSRRTSRTFTRSPS